MDRIFRMYGGIIIAIAIFCMFGLRDIEKRKMESKAFRATLNQCLAAIKNEKSIIVGMLGIACGTMTTIAVYQFGIVIYLE